MSVCSMFAFFNTFRSLYGNIIGLWLTVSLAVFSGLTMYSIYKNCDPLTNGDVGALDQVSKCKTAMALTQAWTVLHDGSVIEC